MNLSVSRDLPGDVFQREPDDVYKHDTRSTVWRSGDFVVKRYNHARWKQVLTLALGLHPGQREERMARRLSSRGVPVVRVVGSSVHGGCIHTATRCVGESVQRVVSAGLLQDREAGKALIERLAVLFRVVVGADVFFRDLQAANTVRDGGGDVFLIDVGSARFGLTSHQRDRMLAMLIRSLRVEGASRMDGLRLLRQVESSGDWKAVARRLIAIDPRVAELNPVA